MEVLITISLLLTIFFVFKAKNYSNRLPPGSMGLPVIGQTPDFLKALKADKVEVWFHERIAKYGPIWKVGLFGNPTIVLHGPSANKFIYSCGQNMLTNTQPPSTSRIFDVQPMIKNLTFNIICSFLIGIERGSKREKLLPLFQDMNGGKLAIPINLPFTQFNRGITARKKLVPIFMDLIREKREALEDQKHQSNRSKDLMTSLISIRDDNGSTMMTDEDIIDNIVAVMVGGYDTTSVLVSFLIRLLATNKSIYSNIVQGQWNGSMKW
ncbi:cytochrome P450 [Artemisia annua]|uniref:Cytochrome P450 n=1 Tax=Artemisia annua TaxID=35608 RepID=A0A2U1KV18_ARTAN|nr:cytochrome P450 [Artemisia annua]